MSITCWRAPRMRKLRSPLIRLLNYQRFFQFCGRWEYSLACYAAARNRLLEFFFCKLHLLISFNFSPLPSPPPDFSSNMLKCQVWRTTSHTLGVLSFTVCEKWIRPLVMIGCTEFCRVWYSRLTEGKHRDHFFQSFSVSWKLSFSPCFVPLQNFARNSLYCSHHLCICLSCSL